jgi:hypothetical protein
MMAMVRMHAAHVWHLALVVANRHASWLVLARRISIPWRFAALQDWMDETSAREQALHLLPPRPAANLMHV